MFKKILVALENSETDQALLPKVADLAKLAGSELLLVHVADGWVARNFEQLKLAESEEMREDREYLDATAATLRGKGLTVMSLLAMGDPPSEILKVAQDQQCDLIAMTTHGHRLIGDIIYGETIEKVRHQSPVPMFIVSAKAG